MTLPLITTGDLGHLLYSDALLLQILRKARTIAMVGASPSWNRPSYFAMRYLQRKGYRVIPVNPRALDALILGEPVYPDLRSIPGPVDVVDVFRRASDVPPIAEDAAAIDAHVLWLQLGVRSEAAAAIAEGAGLTVIQDRCMKIEYARLSGELSWSGTPSPRTETAAPTPTDARIGKPRQHTIATSGTTSVAGESRFMPARPVQAARSLCRAPGRRSIDPRSHGRWTPRQRRCRARGGRRADTG